MEHDGGGCLRGVGDVCRFLIWAYEGSCLPTVKVETTRCGGSGRWWLSVVDLVLGGSVPSLGCRSAWAELHFETVAATERRLCVAPWIWRSCGRQVDWPDGVFRLGMFRVNPGETSSPAMAGASDDNVSWRCDFLEGIVELWCIVSQRDMWMVA